MSFRRSRCGVLLVALAATGSIASTPRSATAQASAEAAAQLRFQHARELFAANHFEEALAEFRAVVAIVPSPNTRLYIARCLHQLGRNAEALLEYQHAAAEAADRAGSEARYAATRDAARGESSTIEPLVGRITIRVNESPPDLVVTVDGQQISAALVGIAAPYDPRSYRIGVRARGFRATEREVTVAAGRTSEVTFALERDPNAIVEPVDTVASSAPPPTTPATRTQPIEAPRMVTVREGGGVRLAGIGIGALGVLVAVAGTAAFGVMAQSRYDELHATCATGCPEMESRIAEGITYRTLANASLGVGIGLAAIGVVMIAVGGPREVQRPASARVRVVPSLSGVTLAF